MQEHRTTHRPASWRRRAGWTAGLITALAMAGCVVAGPPHYVLGGAVAYGPPAPYREVVGVAPGPGWFWIGGYWRWGGARYLWVPGRWAARRPGFRWAPRHWVHRRGGWFLVGGRWLRR